MITDISCTNTFVRIVKYLKNRIVASEKVSTVFQLIKNTVR